MTPSDCCRMPTFASGPRSAADYSTNSVVLHTDTSILPKRRPAWASWNVGTLDCAVRGGALTMTYDMNRLQSLAGPAQYLVSLNAGDRLDPNSVVSAREMRHPMYTFSTLRSQERVVALQGIAGRGTRGRTWATASTRTAVARAMRRPRRWPSGPRSRRHEKPLAGGYRAPPPQQDDELRAGACGLLLRPRPGRARRGDRRVPLVRRIAGLVSFRDATTSRTGERRGGRSPRSPPRAGPPAGRLADHPRHQPAGAGLRLQSSQLLPAATAVAGCRP